jgi:hypothetical protein
VENLPGFKIKNNMVMLSVWHESSDNVHNIQKIRNFFPDFLVDKIRRIWYNYQVASWDRKICETLG